MVYKVYSEHAWGSMRSLAAACPGHFIFRCFELSSIDVHPKQQMQELKEKSEQWQSIVAKGVKRFLNHIIRLSGFISAYANSYLAKRVFKDRHLKWEARGSRVGRNNEYLTASRQQVINTG